MIRRIPCGSRSEIISRKETATKKRGRVDGRRREKRGEGSANDIWRSGGARVSLPPSLQQRISQIMIMYLLHTPEEVEKCRRRVTKRINGGKESFFCRVLLNPRFIGKKYPFLETTSRGHGMSFFVPFLWSSVLLAGSSTFSSVKGLLRPRQQGWTVRG